MQKKQKTITICTETFQKKISKKQKKITMANILEINITNKKVQERQITA